MRRKRNPLQRVMIVSRLENKLAKLAAVATVRFPPLSVMRWLQATKELPSNPTLDQFCDYLEKIIWTDMDSLKDKTKTMPWRIYEIKSYKPITLETTKEVYLDYWESCQQTGTEWYDRDFRVIESRVIEAINSAWKEVVNLARTYFINHAGLDVAISRYVKVTTPILTNLALTTTSVGWFRRVEGLGALNKYLLSQTVDLWTLTELKQNLLQDQDNPWARVSIGLTWSWLAFFSPEARRPEIIKALEKLSDKVIPLPANNVRARMLILGLLGLLEGSADKYISRDGLV